MSAASTRTLLEQLREHMDGNEAASQAKYEKLEADMKARIQELERKNAEMSKELVEEKGRTRRAMHILSGSDINLTLGPSNINPTPGPSTVEPPADAGDHHQGPILDDPITIEESLDQDGSPTSDLTDLAFDDDAGLPEDWRKDREELDRMRKEVEALRKGGNGVPMEQVAAEGDTIHQSPRVPLESIVYTAKVLADRHHFGTLANLNITCRHLREETRPILERTLVLDTNIGWWTDASAVATQGQVLQRKWPHTEFVISEPCILSRDRYTLFPNLRLWIVKRFEMPDPYYVGAISSSIYVKPKTTCDIIIVRAITTYDLAYVLSTSLFWQHSGTKFQTPADKIGQVSVESAGFVTEASIPIGGKSFKLDAPTAGSAFTFKYLHKYPSERLAQTMMILDRLFVRDSWNKTIVELEEGIEMYDNFMRTIENRLQRKLAAEIKIRFPVRLRRGCHSNKKRESLIPARAEATAEIYQRHWKFLPKYLSAHASPFRTKETPIGQRYKPEPFLTVSIEGNGPRSATGPFTIQLHQKGNDLDCFWLDVLGSYWVERGAGEVETGEAGQAYTRPGAVLHKKYAVVRPTSR